MAEAKTPAKAKGKTTTPADSAAQDQATDTTVAAATTTPRTPAAVTTGQQDQAGEGDQSNGDAEAAAPADQAAAVVAEQGAELAQALPVNGAGQLVVAAEQVAAVEPVAGGELVGANASVAVVDEFEDVGEPWYGLQRAVSDVAIERLRQVQGEGFTLERDDAYTDGQLARAATCLLIPAAGLPRRLQNLHWPFAQEWLKPGLARDDLVKAGALIVAEIERLDRAEAAA